MNKYKEKIGDILNKIKGNKRVMYLTFCTVLVLFCLVLNVTFAKYTSRNNLTSANINIGKLKYNMQVNNGELEDRILRITKNSTLTYDVNLTSLNNFDTKYELIYEVCSDQNCTSTITMPTDLEIRKLSTTLNDITGSINKHSIITISIAGINGSSTTDYYIKLGLNAGYAHNELALANQIKDIYNYDGNAGVKIIAYVDGNKVSSFPSTRYYTVSSECEVAGIVDNNIKIISAWNYEDSKWDMTISKISKANTICNIYFEEGLLLADAIRQDYPIISEPKTTPGAEASTEAESLLAETTDDYGTSYYFRGTIPNNYVQFANKCWRMVRITGNGAVKLVLHNDNVNNTDNPCDAANNDTNAAFARYSGTTYTLYYNMPATSNAYVGFMYGTAGSSTYALEHANKYDSSILRVLKVWYDLTFSASQKEQLADVIWCNDKFASTYNDSRSYYAYYYRSRSPRLECGNAIGDEKLSKFTGSETTYGNGALKGYKIGLLTADEVAFSGSGSSGTNSDSPCYLYENANGTTWWTMTPYDYSSGKFVGASVASINTSGDRGYNYVTARNAVRPSIALVSTTKVSGGNGLPSDPFIID